MINIIGSCFFSRGNNACRPDLGRSGVALDRLLVVVCQCVLAHVMRARAVAHMSASRASLSNGCP